MRRLISISKHTSETPDIKNWIEHGDNKTTYCIEAVIPEGCSSAVYRLGEDSIKLFMKQWKFHNETESGL
jgi:hypothetical protein